MTCRKIVVERGTTKELVEVFGTNRITVWQALTFQTDTMLAKRIRKAAMERGGVEISQQGKERCVCTK